MGCKLPTYTPPEDLSSIKSYSADEPSEDLPEKKAAEEIYEPPKKKKRKDKKAPQKSLELKLGSESDTEKRVDTPSVSMSFDNRVRNLPIILNYSPYLVVGDPTFFFVGTRKIIKYRLLLRVERKAVSDFY